MRWVAGLTISMKHPADDKEVTNDLYSGETVDGKPYGLGTFATEDGWEGFGEFINGELHGKGYWVDSDGWRGSYQYSQGARRGYGKFYYPDGRKGIVNSEEKEDIGGMAYYAGDYCDGCWHGNATSYNWSDGRVFVGDWE